MRYAHVCTSHGVNLPAVSKAAAAEIFAKAAEAQLAKGRRKPVRTNVAKYVTSKAPAVSRALRKVLKAWAKKIAPKAAKLYAEKLQKDTGSDARIRAIIEELNNGSLGEDLAGELEGPMLAAFKRAAAIGATQVGFELADITDQVDEAAVAFAADRGGELIKDLAGTTDEAMQALLARAVNEGMSSEELSQSIEDMGAFGDYRADLIARTELAFAHVQGNVEGWKAAGDQVEGKRSILGDLHDVPDECDDAADAGVVGLDEDFGDGLDFPPYHPDCCVSGTMVAPAGRISAQFSRGFEGEIVEIRTAKNHLSVTLNHPVLTPRGWVSAGALQVGDHVLECSDPAQASAIIDPDNHYVPARIEDVSGAILMAGGMASRGMPATAEAFHGDGMVNGKVDVVWAAGALALDSESGALKRRIYARLGLSHRKWRALASKSNLAALSHARATSPDSGMRSLGVSLALVGAEVCVDQQPALVGISDPKTEAHEYLAQSGAVAPDGTCQLDGRFSCDVSGVNRGDLVVGEASSKLVHVTGGSDSNSALAQQALDHLVGHGQLGAEAANGLSGLISAAEVIQLSRRKFKGHVYNLSTAKGWYFANAIITHNCVCDIVPVLSDSADQGDGE